MTSLPMRPAAVLLDMDGTIVHSDDVIEEAWGAWAQENGADVAEVLTYCHGRDPADTLRHFRPDLDEPAIAAMLLRQIDVECDMVTSLRPTPGALDLVTWLEAENLPWAVVTNAVQRLARIRLVTCGIDAPLLVGLDDVADGKPAPDGYLSAARQLGVDPARCLAVEDSPSGLTAARAAGCMTAGVRNLPDADVVCADLTELVPLLAATTA